MSIVPVVLQQHADDAMELHATRTLLAAAPHVKLHHLWRFDDRLAAHLDGLRVVADYSWGLCQSALEQPSPSAIFCATINAIGQKRADRLESLLALIEAIQPCGKGLLSACGWLEWGEVRAAIDRLLESDSPTRRAIGLAGYLLHRLDPGLEKRGWIVDPAPLVRARALRAAGELGSGDLRPELLRALADRDESCRFWAAWSATLLGDRQLALRTLADTWALPVQRKKALRLLLQALSPSAGHDLLQQFSGQEQHLRDLIEGSGIVGDPRYVLWVIGHMTDNTLARLAGETFSLITGVDLALRDLEKSPPPDFESGPNDNPDDGNVDMDPDDGLPWPDPDKVEKWWAANASRFHKGTRYFMGALVTREHCIEVLKNGYQRQRILAAHYLCLLNPGTPLFNTSAPAWRQQRLLARM